MINIFIIYITFCFYINLIQSSGDAEFNYSSQGSDWTGTCSTGTQQSPINLPTYSATNCSTDIIADVRFTTEQQASSVLKFPGESNTYKNIESEGEWSKFLAKTVDGDNHSFRALQFHIHSPSEHQINGVRTDVELHIVHAINNQDYTGQMQNAVVGIFFNVGSTASDAQTFFSKWGLETFTSSTGTLNNLQASTLFSELNINSGIWAYKGSLTTPPCTESVNWFLWNDIQAITQSELDFIQNLFNNDSTISSSLGNYREIQNLEGRTPIQVCSGQNTADFTYVEYTETDAGHSETPTIDYDYSNQGSNWEDLCQTGKKQSPIDLPAYDLSSCTDNYGANVQFSAKKVESVLEFPGDSHGKKTIESIGNWSKLKADTIGGNKHSFQAAQFHIHSPSEHTINGQRMDAELHIVHSLVDTGYDGPMQNAVVGMFFQLDETIAEEDTLFGRWDVTSFTSTTGKLTDLQASYIFSDFDNDLGFWQYEGSLTTPPCTESVNWFLWNQMQPITQTQLSFIQNLFQTDENINSNLGNYRNIQNKNGRIANQVCPDQSQVDFKFGFGVNNINNNKETIILEDVTTSSDSNSNILQYSIQTLGICLPLFLN